MHVLFIPSWYKTYDDPVKGSFFTDQAKALIKKGIKIGLVYSESYRSLKSITLKRLINNRFNVEKCKEDNMNVLRYHGWNLFPKREKATVDWWIKTTIRLVLKYIRIYGKPDIIHAQSAIYAGYAAKLIYDKIGIPYIITEHFSGYSTGTIINWKKDYAQRAFNSSKCNIAVSRILATFVTNTLNLKQNNFEIIPNLIDCDYFYKAKKNDKNKFVFQTISFLTANKGVDLLIKAFSKSFSHNDKVLLRIGGTGVEEANLYKLVENLSIQDKVEFMGQLKRQDVVNALNSADVFVLPSKFETFGVVIIEALSAGIPVISTKCGGPEEIIKDEKIGVIINERNVESLSDKLIKVYENYDFYNKEYILNYVRNNYSDKIISERIMKIYHEIVKSR